MIDTARQIFASAPNRNAETSIDSALREAEGCVLTLRGLAISNRITELGRDAVLAEQSGETELFNQLVHEQLELEKIRRSLQPNSALM